jgi:DNA-binding NtrC family response regulator
MDDLPALAQALIARHLKRRQAPDGILSRETLTVLNNYDWPGNVRELANALEHAVILSDGQLIAPEDLPSSLTSRRSKLLKPLVAETAVSSTLSAATSSSSATSSISPVNLSARTIHEMEREMILAALERHQGDKPKVASELGIALKTLYNKINQYQAEAASRAS